VPPELDAIVLRALAKRPGSRYGDAREMERALVDALIHIRGESPATRRVPTSSRVRAAAPIRPVAAETAPIPSYRPPAPPAPPPATARGGREPKRRRSGWIAPALLAVIALSVLIAALVKATGDANDDSNTPGPTRTRTEQAAVLGPGTETPGPTATHRVINWPNPTEDTDPTQTPRPTRTPRPTQEPTQTPEPTAEDSNGGVPTIAPSGGGGVTKAPTETPAANGGDIQPVSESFSASDWQGGFTRTDSEFLGRPWAAVYGEQSGYGQASLTFSLDAAPTSDATLTITGVDDEAGGDSPISIAVNGTEVFSGPSPFPSWDGSSADGPWTAVPFSIPARLLQAGTNQITVSNLNPSGNTDSPPYVLLSDATLTTE
jgi:hypothetical protein